MLTAEQQLTLDRNSAEVLRTAAFILLLMVRFLPDVGLRRDAVRTAGLLREVAMDIDRVATIRNREMKVAEGPNGHRTTAQL